MRKHQLRSGTAAWPLVGVGHFVVASADNWLALCVVNLQTMIAKAGMESLERFDDALEGRELNGETHAFIVLRPNAVAWAPYGHAALVASDVDIGKFTIIPSMVQSKWDEMDEETKDLVFAANERFLKKNAAMDESFPEIQKKMKQACGKQVS